MAQSQSGQFDALRQHYYQAWYRFYPERAVDIGIADYAGNLRSYAADDAGALIALDNKMLSALAELDVGALDGNQQLDYRILSGAVELELHELEERDWRLRNPRAYVPVRAIYQLLIHPVANVHEALKHRLGKIPEYLRGARSLLEQSADTVVPQWLQQAVTECAAGGAFIRNLGRHPLITQKFTNPARLQPLFDEAAHALDEFKRFLETTLAPRAQGRFACGLSSFERRLHKLHFLDVSAAQLRQLGERLLAATRADMLALTRHMQGNDDVRGLLEKIRRQHPTRAQLLERYRSGMHALDTWLAHAGLVDLPPKQMLKVQETPEFMRPLIPFAAYQPPLPNDPEQQGWYYVSTPRDDHQLTAHNRYSIDLTCAHEAYPGHHLQFVIANNAHAANPVRLLNVSASLYEGWALYCEQLVLEQGYLDQDEHRFIMLHDRLWRALRIIIDVDIHTAAMTLDAAAQRMVDELGFDKMQAQGELGWYSAAPTVPLCYATGRELILAARRQCVDGGTMPLAAFHNKLLSQGSIALPLVIGRVYGADTWQQTRAAVFGECTR